MRWLAGLALLLAWPAAAGEILWDGRGVPHIYGDTDEEVWEGFGRAQAELHTHLLLRLYGEARGRAAEYWGGEAHEASDRYLLLNDVPGRAARWHAAQAPEFRALLDAFARGINGWADAHRDRIDPDVAQVLPVTGTDIVAHAHKLMQFQYIAPRARVMAEPEVSVVTGASNAWALAPARTRRGHALLLQNPHLPWAPSQLTYTEAHLVGPGWWIYGATQVGLPVIRFAFNDRAGFTNTVNQVPGFSRYRLQLAPGGYVLDGAVRPFEVETLGYRVRLPDGSRQERTLERRSTLHGPVFEAAGGSAFALRVAGLDRPHVLHQYWSMSRSRNLAEFEAALASMQVPMFNLVYADADGRILYVWNGLFPRRAAPEQGLVDGSRSDLVWHDLLALDELPRVVDPPTGFVQNANDPPWLATWPRQLHPADFPADVAPPGPFSLRAQQSVRLMADDRRHTLESLAEAKHDTTALMAVRLVPELVAAARAHGDDDAGRAAGLLAGWDTRFDADARAALVFEEWARLFAPRNFTGEENFARAWTLDDALETPSGIADPAAAARMLGEAARTVVARHGRLDVPFGQTSRFALGDEPGHPGHGGFGNMGIFRVMTWGPWRPGPDGQPRRTPTHGETWMAVIEFGPQVRAVGSLAYGNTSEPGSPVSGGQLGLLAERRLVPLLLDRAAIEAAAVRREDY